MKKIFIVISSIFIALVVGISGCLLYSCSAKDKMLVTDFPQYKNLPNNPTKIIASFHYQYVGEYVLTDLAEIEQAMKLLFNESCFIKVPSKAPSSWSIAIVDEKGNQIKIRDTAFYKLNHYNFDCAKLYYFFLNKGIESGVLSQN